MELARTYTLRLKDIPLVKFTLLRRRSMVNYTENITYHFQINKVYAENKKLLPKFLLLQNEVTEEKIKEWISKRKVPPNRQFAENLLCAIGDDKNPMHYVDSTQAKLFVEKRHIPALRKLTMFTFKNHPKYPLAENTLNFLSAFIQRRARDIIELYRVREKEHQEIVRNLGIAHKNAGKTYGL